MMVFMQGLFLATFTCPENIATNPLATLWIIPLMVAIAVVYKTTKLPEITLRVFLKETVGLFLTMFAFIVLTAIVLHIIAYLISV